MSMWSKFQKWAGSLFTPKVNQKSFWSPMSGLTGGTYDAFGGQAEPNKTQMVKAFDDIVFACVNLIAQSVSQANLKLYVNTYAGQRKPKCLTAPVSEKGIRKYRTKYFGSDVKEVIEHPLLNLIRHCNAYHNSHDLLEQSQIYLDLTGNSYWYRQDNVIGLPEQLFLLPSHLMNPERDSNGYISCWKLNQGTTQETYLPSEIIHLTYPNPLDPYGEGMSPLRAAWGRRQVQAKELSFFDNYLSNQGRPDAVLSIKDGINPFEAERLSKEFYQRYQGQGSGGIFVVDGTMNLQPLNFPAKDLAELQLYQVLKTVICNCFLIPPDIFELGTSSNRSTREAALYSLAAQCLQPRLNRIIQKLNDKLVPFFDNRFFFDADSLVPDDKEFELQKLQMLLSQQVITRDEARIPEGFPSEEWAREPLLPSGVLPAAAMMPQSEESAPQEPVEEPKDRTAQAQAVQALQTAYYSGQLPREAALAQLRILYEFSPDEAAALCPEKQQEQHQEQPEQQPTPEPPKPPEAPPEAGKSVQQPEQQKGGGTLDVPDFRQADNYDCGAAATHSVAAFFGTGETSQADFIAALGTNPQEGTRPQAIIAYLESVGLSCKAAEGMTTTDLADAVDNGCPVIVCADDHWVVVTGIDDNQVYLQDPSHGPTEVALDAFDGNWADKDADGKVYNHYGIVVWSTVRKAVRQKALRAISPLPLVRALEGFFRKLEASVTHKFKAYEKAIDVTDWFEMDGWVEAMNNAVRPVLATYYEHAAKETVTQLNMTGNLFRAVQPKLREGVEKAALVFCQETLNTTRLDLNTARETLKKEITEGLEVGDVKNAMMERVKNVFENASTNRAFMIGVTEASRGQHNAMILTAKESGVVKGKTWLLSDDACPLCKPLSGKTVELDATFMTDGEGPYAAITAPPRHPHCRCALTLLV